MNLYERLRRTAAEKMLKSHAPFVLEWIKEGDHSTEPDPASTKILVECIESFLIVGGARLREAFARRLLLLDSRSETPLCEHGKYVLGTEPPGTNRAFVCQYCYPPGPWEHECASNL